jgi:tetratricopeptide (TPR) repeat protein
MSPEQWGVITAVREGRPVACAVDRRTDVYSLGALLYEALGGPVPDSPAAMFPRLSRFNSRVSPGLSDIIAKCVSQHPCDRYPDAAALASDLRRHLGNLPLRGVANRSLVERSRKLWRRRPGALQRGLAILVALVSVLGAVGSIGLWYRGRVLEIDSAHARGRQLLSRGEYKEAGEAFEQGLSLANRLPGAAHRKAALEHERAIADRGVRIEELHRLAELVRFRYGVALPPEEEAKSLIRVGRAIWDGRDRLIHSLASSDEPLLRERTRRDLIDIVVLWAELLGRDKSTEDAGGARTAALHVLTEAEAVLGLSPALERQRRAYERSLGIEKASPPAVFKANSAEEHLDLGKSYIRSGDLERAVREFDAGLAVRPQDFWLNFYEGLCAYRLKRYEAAASAFRVSIALSPEAAECYYNRGLAHQALGRLDEAVADYDRALKLDGRFIDAAINRGIIHHRLGRDHAARDDLNGALVLAQTRKSRGIIHYNLALIDLAAGDRWSCESNVRSAIELGNADAVELSRRLR